MSTELSRRLLTAGIGLPVLIFAIFAFDGFLVPPILILLSGLLMWEASGLISLRLTWQKLAFSVIVSHFVWLAIYKVPEGIDDLFNTSATVGIFAISITFLFTLFPGAVWLTGQSKKSKKRQLGRSEVSPTKFLVSLVALLVTNILILIILVIYDKQILPILGWVILVGLSGLVLMFSVRAKFLNTASDHVKGLNIPISYGPIASIWFMALTLLVFLLITIGREREGLAPGTAEMPVVYAAQVVILVFLAGWFVCQHYNSRFLLRDSTDTEQALRSFVLWVILLVFSFTGLHVLYEFHGPWILIAILGTCWGTDSAAYFVGKSVGRKKLVPLISPNKTVEGTLGGFLFGALLVLGFTSFASDIGVDLGISQVILLAIGVPILAIFGDLIESAFKRLVDAKDSGSILPGHGGLLDRLDSVFLVPGFVLLVLLAFQ